VQSSNSTPSAERFVGRGLTAVSLFSGCGGFDYGVQQAGVEIIWANDIDPHAAAAYRAVFPATEFVLRSVCDLQTFPTADILIGCYPCTGFSLGARRRWKDNEKRDLLADERNYLYREFLRALGQVRPKYLFVENVRGMLSAENGWFFTQQLQGFRDSGYNVKFKCLSAVEYGVPQSRSRIFIVGIRSDLIGFDYAFPKPTHGPLGYQPYSCLREAIGFMEGWPEGEYFDYPFHGHYLSRNRKRKWNEPSFTVVANHHHAPLHPMGEPMQFVGKDKWELKGDQNRRLSWRECAAIQGLPAEAVPCGTLADKYRVVGNAVPPAFGRALLGPIIAYEQAGSLSQCANTGLQAI
jgi:DNA (cytosine-5)-methyltransferase 1